MTFDRRRFLQYSAVTLAGAGVAGKSLLAQAAAAATQVAPAPAAPPLNSGSPQQMLAQISSATHRTSFHSQPPAGAIDAGKFHFAIVSDTHVIDRFYVPGSENGAEDNDSILHANERLATARDSINAIRFSDGSRVEQVFLPGDVFHNYPSGDYDFYFQNETRIDIAAKLLAGFEAPTHVGFGNHDYDSSPKTAVSREMSHRLFEAKLKTKPYYAVDYKGIRFVHMNNFLGDTWAPGSTKRNLGSFGEQQLQWGEAQLAARKPTVLFVHYPMTAQMPTEVRDFGIVPLVKRYQDNILLVVAGHWHRWVDFSDRFGPQHTVIAATRYDPNAFMVFSADGTKGTVDWVDSSRPQWATHFAAPFRNS